MKIVIDKDIPFIAGRFPENVETVFRKGSEITPEDVKDADALLVRTRTKCNRLLLEGSTVKLVASATIGTDHIDIPWCEQNSIQVRNAPGCNAPGVAQYVFAALFRLGFDPGRHTLGIIGCGNVGSVVKEWAQEMGVKTMICDPPLAEKSNSSEDFSSLGEVLENCDAVTLHVPLTSEGPYPTRGLIGEKELSLMKPDAILVNSSRGGVVKESDFKRLIDEKGLKAVVDVWENEPDIDEELLSLATISTPHIAGYSLQGKKRGTAMVLRALMDCFPIEADLSGLECIPTKGKKISKQLIEGSYNPLIDHLNLTGNLSDFEALRSRYEFRNEPLFFD